MSEPLEASFSYREHSHGFAFPARYLGRTFWNRTGNCCDAGVYLLRMGQLTSLPKPLSPPRRQLRLATVPAREGSGKRSLDSNIRPPGTHGG